jgi:hypothetical protein
VFVFEFGRQVGARVYHQGGLHAEALPAGGAGVGALVPVLVSVFLLGDHRGEPFSADVAAESQFESVHPHVGQEGAVFRVDFGTVGAGVRGGLAVDGGVVFAQVFRIVEVLVAITAGPRVSIPAEEFNFGGDAAVVVRLGVA